MSKQKMLTIAVVGLLLLNLGLIGFLMLQKPMHPPGVLPMSGAQQGPRQLIIDKLHLDTTQVARYEELILDHKARVKVLDEEINTTKNKLYITLAEEAQPGKDSLISHLGDLQKEVEKAHYNHFESIKGLCRPDQQGDFQALTMELARYFPPMKTPPPPPKDM